VLLNILDSNWSSRNVDSGAATLLHELGHLYNLNIYAFGGSNIVSDSNNAALSQKNSDLISSKCHL